MLKKRITLLRSTCLVCFGAISITLTATSQTTTDTPFTQDQSAIVGKSSPATAYVYVSQASVNPGPNQVLGFKAAADGRLEPIPGSPFVADVDYLAATGKYLFGATTDQLYLNSYKVNEDGALSFAAANDLLKLTGYNYGENLALTLDHTGATLYLARLYADGSNDSYESFSIDKVMGTLALTPGFIWEQGDDGIFTISANDKYLYDVPIAYPDDYQILIYDRANDGTLQIAPPGTPVVPLPAPKSGFRFKPVSDSADPENHVAVACMNMQWYGSGGIEDGPEQIAVYTADSKGILKTNSTWKNMTTVSVGHVKLRMSPSGKLLAAAGDQGLEIFHFNGSAPATAYVTPVKNVAFSDTRWDNDNHLFALSQTSGKLYVFTVTPNHVSQAAGSPYSVPGAREVIVSPR